MDRKPMQTMKERGGGGGGGLVKCDSKIVNSSH